jgi:hypothetical protein
MFKLSQSETYFWPVTVEVPMDGGKFDKQTFDAEFKRLDQTRLKEIYEKAGAGELTDASIAAEVLAGWKSVSDESGDVPFSETSKQKLLNVPLVTGSVVKAFFESIAGSKRKN